MTFLRGSTRSDSQCCPLPAAGVGALMKQKQGQPLTSAPSQILQGRVGPHPWPSSAPHLHLNIGVGQVVLWRQLAVVVDEMVQDGGAQDGLHGREKWVRAGTVGRILRVMAS